MTQHSEAWRKVSTTNLQSAIEDLTRAHDGDVAAVRLAVEQTLNRVFTDQTWRI